MKKLEMIKKKLENKAFTSGSGFEFLEFKQFTFPEADSKATYLNYQEF